MNRILPLILFVWWSAALSHGAPAPAGAPAPRYRYLFLYDCSYSMSKAAPTGRQAIADLIYSGLQERMQPGEVFGVWPFSFQVFTNRIAPMTWQPGAHQALSDGTLAMLQVMRNEKQTKMDVLWREVTQAARASDQFMALIVTDGDDPFKGTPFDAALNQMVKTHAKELRRARKPFLAVLSAVKGQFVAYTIGPAGEPIDFQSLNQQIARVIPPEPLAPLVTNIITTNIIIVTNFPVVATDTPRAPRETLPVAATHAAPATLSEPSQPPSDLAPLIATNGPDNLGVFTQPPPLQSEVKTNPPATTAQAQTNPPPVRTANASKSISELAVSTPSRPPAEKPPPVQTQAKPVMEVKTPAPPASPPAARPVATNPAPSAPVSVTPAIARAKTAVPPLAPAPKKTSSPQDTSFWREKGKVILFASGSVVVGVAIFLFLYRAAQRKPQPSFISQSIDKHLR